jgi:predicted nuclease of restriction endonuclease-like (RecB) superfamily
MSEILADNYQSFLKDIKERIRSAHLGKMIVERQDKEGWGKSVVERLAKDLQKEFPGIKGFSVQNLWYMRQFYLTYRDNEKLQPMVGEISWSKHIIIMSKCKDDLEREFYIKMTKKFGWTKNVLIHQIESQAYERFLLNQTNFDQALPEKYRPQAKLAVKDEYTFDFLELGEEHSERELELALINNIRRFLIEMGGYFTFIGNQYRLEVGGDEFFVDLLLYHRKLRCLVAIELKVGEFKPEYAGKMQFYLAVLNDTIRLAEENPSIGIILCKEKNRIIVEYALKDTTQPIGVSTYKITTTLPEELQKYLPSGEEIAKRLEGVEL